MGGAVGAAAVLAAGAFAGVSAASNGPSGLRTTVVAVHPVERSLSLVGSVEPVTQAAVSFPVSGTVAAVDVAVGDAVVAGQTLATLDTTSLLATLHSRQASLDQSRLSLAQALAGGSTGSTGTGSSSSSGASAGASTGSGGGGSSSGGAVDQAALGPARQAVADAQHSVDTQLAAASAALDAATRACGTTPPAAGGGGPTTTTPTTAPPSTATTTTAPVQGGGDTATCQAALQTALGAQQSVAAAQQALQDAVGHLESLLAGAGAGAGSGGSTSTPSTTARSTTGSGGSSVTSSASASRSASGATGGGSARAVGTSADDLIAAQKAVDAAGVQVAVAQQAVDAAAVTTPIGGRVVAVNLTPGQQVGAGSTTATIVVAGDGGFEVTANVSVTDLPHVHVGEQATVTPDGTTSSVPASVVQIGLNPTTSASGTTTYPVVLALRDGDPAGLHNGGLVAVQVTTGETGDVLAVPTSAVTTDNGRRTVAVVEGGTTRTVAVSVGTVGSAWTEVTDGLQAGQTVVLADLGRALPGSATSSGSTATAGTAGTARTGNRTAGTGGLAGPPGG